MKKTKANIIEPGDPEDLLPEYRFDYSKARPNRFAGIMAKDPIVRVSVTLDSDVSQVFPTSESVNKALRCLIEAMQGVKPL